MAAPTDAIAAILQLQRTKTGYGSKTVDVSRTMTNLVEFNYIEQKLTAGSTGTVINFGPVASADFILLYTPQPIGLHVSNVAAQEIRCGSIWLCMDSDVTSLAIDNDLLTTPADVTVEIWLGTTTG